MKIACFYHAKLSGAEFGIDLGFSRQLVSEQMRAFKDCGLRERTDHLVFGFNDTQCIVDYIRDLLPENSEIILNPGKRSELPTMHYMQSWCREHPSWAIMYWHGKGITHPHDSLCRSWRLCMEETILWKWERCVLALNSGFDCAGPHWLTREQYGPQVKTFFFGGNFWWARSNFLNTLPPLKPNSTCRDDDFSAETWIGSGRRPKVFAFSSHWPGIDPCSTTIRRRKRYDTVAA